MCLLLINQYFILNTTMNVELAFSNVQRRNITKNLSFQKKAFKFLKKKNYIIYE